MARNMYGATSADFTLTSGGRVVPGATLTIWSARTGGTQITDLLDKDSVATTTVTSDADGSIVYYGPNNDKTVHWADSGVGNRIAIRPVDITGETGATPALTIGTVDTGAAAASLTGTDEEPVLNLTIPPAANDSITSAMIAADAVGTSEIADGAVTSAKIADGTIATADLANDAVTAAKIAADAVGSSEIAAGAVGTAEIADAAVTVAKLGSDVRIGNLLTANQASVETDTTGLEAWDSCTISRSADVPLHGSYGLKVTPTGASPIAGIAAPGVPVTPHRAYTFVTDLYVTAAATMNGVIYWRKSDNTLISVSASPNIVFTGEDREWAVVNATAPALAAYAMVGAQSTDAVHAFYMDCLGFWEGTSTAKSWAMPGTPIVGLSHIATNGAVHLSGTGSPEGVVTAAPGSTWLQTDSTTDVKGWIRWVKATGTGNTGWVAGPEADTGWRDIASLLVNGWTGTLRLRRIGSTVTLDIVANAAAATSDTFWSGLVLFRPNATAYGMASSGVAAGASRLIEVTTSASTRAYNRGSGDHFGTVSWITDDAWPASLPGSAA